MNNGHERTIDTTAEDRAIAAPPPPTLAQIQSSDVLAQIDAAHRYPRSITAFLAEAKSLAGMSADIAASCIYTVPRAGQQITGASIRLAEICATSWGNLQYGARVVEVGETTLTAEGVCWDTQKNNRHTLRVERRITDKKGRRYSDDMIQTVSSAACSIALRNAIFRVVPRAYVDEVYAHARRVAVGDARTLADKRAALIQRLNALGVTTDRILARVGKVGVDDIGLAEVEVLLGLGTAIKDETTDIDEAFPPVVAAAPEAAPQGQRIKMRGAKATEPQPAPEVVVPDAPGDPAQDAEPPPGAHEAEAAVNAAAEADDMIERIGTLNAIPALANWRAKHEAEMRQLPQHDYDRVVHAFDARAAELRARR